MNQNAERVGAGDGGRKDPPRERGRQGQRGRKDKFDQQQEPKAVADGRSNSALQKPIESEEKQDEEAGLPEHRPGAAQRRLAKSDQERIHRGAAYG